MSARSLWRKQLQLDGKAMVVRVRHLRDQPVVVVSVRTLKRDQLRCGQCGRVSPGYDHGHGLRLWRALDCGPLMVYLEAQAPRARCVEHGVGVAAVPWASHRARHTHLFDQDVVWMARYMSKARLAERLRISWETVGSIIERVMATVDAEVGDRWANLRRIGIDEVSYLRGRRYLIVVVDHATGRLVWAGKGRTMTTLGEFFTLLGPERCAKIALVTADGADYIADMVGRNLTNAKMCMDPFHVVQWANHALDLVRRRVAGLARADKDTVMTGALKDSRWAVLKSPENLTDRQRRKLAEIQKINNPLYRSYLLKEQLRQVFKPGGEDRVQLLHEWLIWAQRSRIAEFVELARKMSRYANHIANSLVHRLTNGPVEGLNARVRLIINLARGFRSAGALIAMLRLHLGGYVPTLPGRQTTT